MKFPITRESLQSYDYDKAQEGIKGEELEESLKRVLDGLCKEFTQFMPQNSKEKKFVWMNIMSIRRLHMPQFRSKTDEYLPLFIEKLKEIFIGCDIIIDPLKTYLIIDWS